MAAKKSPEQPLHPEMPPTDEELARHAALGEPLRRCTGSIGFGIEPHEAPDAGFPKQPSRKDGLGRTCKPHWTAYTAGLRKDALASKAGAVPATDGARTESKSAGPRRAKKDGSTARASEPRQPSAKADEAAKAEALIAEVDALPADEHVKRVGDADMQAALEASATSRMLAD